MLYATECGPGRAGEGEQGQEEEEGQEKEKVQGLPVHNHNVYNCIVLM